jgi:hypothetical protein
MAEGDTLVNAALGAVASIVLTPLVPFAPVAGGTLAGYLQGGDRNDGLTVGALAGALALLPLLMLAVFLTNVFLFFLDGTGPGPFGLLSGLGFAVLVVGVVFAAVYTVGLSALGGWLGNYLKYDTDIGG